MNSALVTIRISSGPVIGFKDTHPLGDASSAPRVVAGQDGGLLPVRKWLGIPYAKADRWCRPNSVAPWVEPLPTLEFGTMFPQGPSPVLPLYSDHPGSLPRSFVGQSEHSHFLNVFASPGVDERASVPVLVWIYGGSLTSGSGDRSIYDPTAWMRRDPEHNPFILVTFNYRTGIFGFFSCSDLEATDPQGLSGNFGAYDTIAALSWVQDNIKSFGGDPENITVFGESAGAFLASNLLVCGRRLFSRAILQSAASSTMGYAPASSAFPAYVTIVKDLNLVDLDAAGRLDALRKLSAEELQQIAKPILARGLLNFTTESGRHATWAQSTTKTIAERGCDPWIESVVLGTNEDEGSLFAWLIKLNTVPALTGLLSTLPPAAAELYPLAQADGDYVTSAGSRLFADKLFNMPAYQMATRLALQKDGPSVYFYRVRDTVDSITASSIPLGSMHSAEIPLIFNSNGLWAPGAHEEATSTVLGSRWLAFARDGIPDCEMGGPTVWKRFNPAAPEWLAFDRGGKTSMEDLTKSSVDERKMWIPLLEKQAGL